MLSFIVMMPCADTLCLSTGDVFLAHYFDGAAGVVALLVHPYLYGYALLQLIHMADDAYMTTRMGVQTSQRVDGVLQRLTAQCAETLVDEEGVYGELIANVAQG